MENFSEVGLGFSEFVGQLLQETFDATLSAQNHQLEKYRELQEALNLSYDAFKKDYLNEEMIADKELAQFGALIENLGVITDDQLSYLETQFDSLKGIVYRGKLTKDGVQKVKNLTIENLVDEYKGSIELLLNRAESTQLVVDSGEIKAKLELSNYYQESQVSKPILAKKMKSKVEAKDIVIGKGDIKSIVNLEATPISIKGISIKEVFDSERNTKVIMVDKAAMIEKGSIGASIPSVRIIARPASTKSASSNATLYSEVTIRFKTV
ncbi:hypothetical protein [Dokdonia sp. Asnod1-B02]|uniref:hypothetical protein n=1 Tax=Dokdonia sp. Asnod1-B02 TaxID=3160573 RepID=UPI00386AD427